MSLKFLIFLTIFDLSTRFVMTSPNIVVILTDDQDSLLKSMEFLPKINNLLTKKGATFTNAFTSSPICCPSRASLLTGLYAHNTRTFNNSRDGGCYSQQWIQNHEPFTIPARLKRAGYETFFAGKYLNQYNSIDVPTGYDEFYGLHGNSKYFNYTLNENGNLTHYEDSAEDYLPNIVKERALEFIRKQKPEKPFFSLISVPSCHAPFTPEDKYENFFQNLTAPRTKNFNIGAKPGEKHWLMTMEPEKLPGEVIDLIDDVYRRRLETLLTVDDLVEEIILELSEQNLINQTFIVFTSDNGYHLGQWAMPFDKRLPYETDIRVPLIVRGPNVIKSVINSPVLLIDLAPTIMNWAKIEMSFDFDGKPFDHLLIAPNSNKIEERQMLIEYWGEGNTETHNPECPYRKSQRLSQCNPEAACKCEDSWNNTYACVRHMSEEINLIFCSFEDRENYQEAYDLSNDVFQMKNIGYDLLPSIRARYQIIAENLSQCHGDSCRIVEPV